MADRTGTSNRTDVEDRAAAPDPDSPVKPEDPTDLTGPSRHYVLRASVREFGEDQCTDLAAALTYYAVLALFPGLIAVLSLVGLLGRGPETVDALLQVLRDVGAGSAVPTIEPILRSLATAPGAGVALVVGLATALWSASGYVNAFGRAMNRILEVEEGRPVWKLRPVMLLVTVVTVALAALVLLALVLTGPAASAVGNALGLGESVVLVWNIAKWPVILLVVAAIVALLYYATPNIKQPRFRWVSVGAGIAILVWVLASAAFGFYVAGFSSYGTTYGSLAGVIVFLLWLWITNLALLLGAEVDSELERARQLQAGLPAEDELQLPARDTRTIVKAERKRDGDRRRARELRLTRGRALDADEDPGPGPGAGPRS